MSNYLLAIDQGTTSSRAIVFSATGKVISISQKALTQRFPQNGWVEHYPNMLWQDVVTTCQDALSKANIAPTDLVAIGITNQRETSVIWNRETGKVIYNAIVWQDRRTANICQQLKEDSLEEIVQNKTGLLLDPYFSATKIMWMLDNVPGARKQAEAGKLAFGTIDTFLLWRLTGGKVHATDASNASRTMLFNIQTQRWDEELLKCFNIPASLLPEVKDSCCHYGLSSKEIFGTEIPITGIAGDQQAAAIGQACFKPGMVKSTYGTGCFMLVNTGEEIIHSKHKLLTTVAYRLDNKPVYALEGSIFSAGAGVQWLHKKAKLIDSPAETAKLAQSVKDSGGVYFVPAFTGLGAPYWNPEARGAILGLTRSSTSAHITRALLEAIGYQTLDLLNAMKADGTPNFTNLRVDGGMVKNNWLCQFLASICNLPIERPQIIETTALGAAYLAGLGIGLHKSLTDIHNHWQREQEFTPAMPTAIREQLYTGWLAAIKRVM